MLDLGAVRPGSTIRIPFSTFDKDDGSSITMTNFAAADILIYKDGSTTERASTAGFTATTDFDSKTGKHVAIIDLADNTTAGFYAAGSEYLVAIDSVTVDAVTVGSWIARFRIGYPNALLDTTIATLSSQTSFTLTAGPAEDDALNGHWVVIHDAASAVQMGKAIILDYTGSTKTVTLVAGTTFTAAAGDNISVMDLAPLQPTVIGRTLDVSTGGEAGIDWANVGTPSSTVSLTNTTVATVTTTTTATNVTTVNGLAANVITAAAIAADAIGASELAADAVAEIADAVWDELQSGHVAAGSFGEIATEIADILVDTSTTLQAELDGIQADTEDIQTRLPAALVGGRIDATVDGTGMEAGATAAIADAVWDEVLSGHLTAGSTGNALNAAGSAGDPWATTLPGSYTGSQAGAILDAILTDTGTTLQAELDGIQADTEDIQSRLPAALVSGRIDASVGAMAANVLTAAATATDFGTEVGTAVWATTTRQLTGTQAFNLTGDITGNLSGSVGSVTNVNNIWTFDVSAGYPANSAALTLYTIGNNVDAPISGLPSAAAISTEVWGETTRTLTGTQAFNLTGNITGNLSGSVGSVTGAVGSVTGAVGSVTATVSADVVSISGDSVAADNLESYLDGTNFMPVDAHKPIFSISGATLTVKKPDGTTTAYTRTLTTDAAAEPVTGSS